MQKAGFIACQDDIKTKWDALVTIYGKENILILNAEKTIQTNNAVYTIEEIVQKTDLLIIGKNALQNEQLLFHTIKKANKLFIDTDYPVSSKLIKKCIDYQSESGSTVAFNVDPFMLISQQLEDISKLKQINITTYKPTDNLVKKIYAYLIFGYFFLDENNIRSIFLLCEDEKNKLKAINAEMYNLHSQHIHINIGDIKDTYKLISAIGPNAFEYKKTFFDNFFQDEYILKVQLDALYIKRPLGTLYHALTVTTMVEQLEAIVVKQGFYL